VVPPNAIRAFAAVFLNLPHRTTRGYCELKRKVGDEIFGINHKLEPCYAAAYGLYRIDWLFRYDHRFLPAYKVARFHILLAMCLLINNKPLPPMNSKDMETRANEIINAMRGNESDKLFLQALGIVDKISGSNMERDHIRRKAITDAMLQRFGLHPAKE
jgi:hypothetical protein